MEIKKIFIIVILLLFISLTSGCSHIEDGNGASDFTIETFTDADIVKTNISHSALGMLTSYINGEGSIQVRKLSGIYELAKFTLTNQNLTIEIDSKCESGNLRIVVIKDGTILEDLPINDSKKIEYSNTSGEYRLRVVAESAKFSIDYLIDYD